MATPTAAEKALATQVAQEFGVRFEVLDALIRNESGWSPTIKNPNSSGRGLIQWIDATAKDLGYRDSADLVAKNPTVSTQLAGPVRAYFKKYAPFATEDEFIASVFYPALRRQPAAVLPANVQAANPGVVTMQDYIDRVKKKLGILGGALPVAALLAAAGGLVLFLAWKKKSGRLPNRAQKR